MSKPTKEEISFDSYLATKSGKLIKYLIVIDESLLKIISSSKGKTKSELKISTMHVKEICKILKEPTSSEGSTAEEIPL